MQSATTRRRLVEPGPITQQCHTIDPSHTRKVPMHTMGSWVPGPSHKNKAPLISSWSPRILDFASSNYQPRVLQSYNCVLQGKIVFMSPAMFFTDIRKA